MLFYLLKIIFYLFLAVDYGRIYLYSYHRERRTDMIRFLYGKNASQKTAEIINALRADAATGKQSVLIVPDQQAVSAERMTLEALPPSAQLSLEVLGFSRLYNRVCREYGGLCYSYITKPIKHLMMWQALREVAPLLTKYQSNAADDPAFIGTMLGTLSELKFAGVDLATLEATVQDVESEELGARISDVCLIWSAYEALCGDRYTDSADDLSRLYETLEEHDFFDGKNVYIDSFTSFTAVEHRIIDRIFATADNVTVSIPLPDPKYSDISTASIEASAKTLCKHAARRGGHTDEIFNGEHKKQHPALRYLYENIWKMNAPTGELAPSADGRISIDVCDTPYAEADAAACRILELLRGGARCNDIVIVMRNPEKYRGIIEPALERGGIPFYFSEKNDVCALAPVKLILSALRIRKFNWRKNDVISHIKTGLCSFSMRSADLFEEYVNTWNISGSGFTSGTWTMNPDGLVDKPSPRGNVILEEANKMRVQLCEPLERLFIMLDAAENVKEMCRAIYNYTLDVSLEDKLMELSDREKQQGDLKSAEEYASAYGIILRALADTATALENVKITPDELLDVLKTVFEQTEIGTIPTSIDEVLIGSAATMRTSEPKYLLALGLREGEFPATVTDTGMFSDADKNTLSELGLSLGEDSDTRSSDELMFVRNAFGCPTEKLFLFTSVSDAKGSKQVPSLPIARVKALFCDTQARNFDGNDPLIACGSPKLAAAHLRNISDSAIKRSVISAVSPYMPAAATLATAPVSAAKCRLDPELVRELIGDTINISPTGIEKYIRCPFSYYAGYMLGLREQKRATFRATDFGSFIHYILEHIIRFCVPASLDAPLPTKEEIRAKVDEVSAEYVRRICPEHLIDNKRMQHLYSKLRRLSCLLIDNVMSEFEDGDFRPAFFELHIDGHDGDPAPMILPLENGARLVLRGFIDRVDLWRNGDDVYVRIVDYKTGSKEFSLEEAREGLGTQMLLYLLCICANPGAKLTNLAGIGEVGKVLPAGITYLSSALPKIDLKSFEASEADILALTEQKLSRSGILLDDEKILNAVSHSSKKELLLGVTKDKDGNAVGKSLISEEDFSALGEEIKSTLVDIAHKIYDGIADCEPKKSGKIDPCKYCTARPLCRRIDGKGDDDDNGN